MSKEITKKEANQYDKIFKENIDAVIEKQFWYVYDDELWPAKMPTDIVREHGDIIEAKIFSTREHKHYIVAILIRRPK